MERVYYLCALVGGTVFALQFVSTLLGFGSDHDLDGGDLHDVDPGEMHDGGDGHADAHGHGFTSLLTFRTLIAGLAFFGFSGMAAVTNQVPQFPSLIIALCSGGVAVYGLAWLMRSLYRLRADGTVTIDQTVGCPGLVYLTIPGNNAGLGKVTVQLPDRTMEYAAMTAGETLLTGTPVVVRHVVKSDTVEVARIAAIVNPLSPAVSLLPTAALGT